MPNSVMGHPNIASEYEIHIEVDGDQKMAKRIRVEQPMEELDRNQRDQDNVENLVAGHSSDLSVGKAAIKYWHFVSFKEHFCRTNKSFQEKDFDILNVTEQESSLDEASMSDSSNCCNIAMKSLIQSSCSGTNRIEYQRLGDQLIKNYLSFQWIQGCNLATRNHLCQGLLTCLSQRRRAARHAKKKSAKSEGPCKSSTKSEGPCSAKLSPAEALRKLKNLLVEDYTSCDEIEQLLRISYPLRQGLSVTKLPFYIHAKYSLMCEISLRLGECHLILREKLVDLETKFKLLINEKQANICDIELHLKAPAAKFGNFLTLTEDFGSFDEEKRPGPCVLYNEVDNDVALFYDGTFVILNGIFDLYEACLVGYGSYYIANREYPSCYGQFLGLLEITFGSRPKPFPEEYRTKKLKSLLSDLKNF